VKNFLRGQWGGIMVLMSFVIAFVVFCLMIYEFLVKDQSVNNQITQPAVTGSSPKSLPEVVSDKVKDARSKQINRIPAELRPSEETQPQ